MADDPERKPQNQTVREKRPDSELLEAVRRLDLMADVQTEQLLDATRRQS